MKTLAEWLAHQQALHPLDIELGLERVREVAQRLGLLPWKIPTILVAGTNGKGSTVAYLTALAQSSGLQVGTFTSPHLQNYQERISINGLPIGEKSLVACFERIEVARLQRGAKVISLTFFEYSTLAAYDFFTRQAVDIAIIEVGLGGRLDATNIIDADVAILSSIGLDHTEWLGATLDQIGAEKAGIFRPLQPVILGSIRMPESVHDVLRNLDCKAQWPVKDFAAEDLNAENLTWTWRGHHQAFKNLPWPSLQGPIQIQNAAAAIAAFQECRNICPNLSAKTLDEDIIGEALRAVSLRGRFQRIPAYPATGPEWILDVAHNGPAAQMLAAALEELPRAGRVVAVAGIFADKDINAIGLALDPQIDAWVLCGLQGMRGLDAITLRARLPVQCHSLALVPDVAAGCATALALSKPGDRIVVLGSFMTVGPALDWLGL